MKDKSRAKRFWYIDKVQKIGLFSFNYPLLVSVTKAKQEDLERMLTMPEIHYIKHLRETMNLSISRFQEKVGKAMENSEEKYA